MKEQVTVACRQVIKSVKSNERVSQTNVTVSTDQTSCSSGAAEL
jgi:hypothetical protein